MGLRISKSTYVTPATITRVSHRLARWCDHGWAAGRQSTSTFARQANLSPTWLNLARCGGICGEARFEHLARSSRPAHGLHQCAGLLLARLQHIPDDSESIGAIGL